MTWPGDQGRGVSRPASGSLTMDDKKPSFVALICDENWQPVQLLTDDRCTGYPPCGGCDTCLLMQAQHYGATQRLRLHLRLPARR